MDIQQIIKKRKTEKVLGSVTEQKKNPAISYNIFEWITTAGHAPFHYPSHTTHHTNELTSVVPWRFFVLNETSCKKLLSHFQEANIEAGKIAQMLACCDYLIMATWLPEPSENADVLFESSLENMEHIAGASAAIQNLLLTATSENIPNYWSSGGKLRTPEVFNLLNIPLDQILLGGIFLFPEETKDTQTVLGAWREKKGSPQTWSKFIEL